MPRLPLLLAASLLAAPAVTRAQQPAPKLTFLEDEAEPGGFDVTASLKSLPATWSLCEDDEGAYRLRLSREGATLALRTAGAEKVLARVALPLKPGPLVIQRRGAMWRVLLNARQVLEAHDATRTEGRVGYAGAAQEARLQPVEELAFDDDFMRVKEEVALAAAKNDPRQGVRISDVKSEETLWRAVSGGWATTGLSENAEAQVAQSVNAFVFKSTAIGDNLALAGRPFWNDYALEASVRPEGAKSIGLAAYAQDPKNLLLFKWQADGEGNTGRALLQSIVDGKATTLAQSSGGFEDLQWYRLKLSVVGDLVRAFVDDREVARARTTLFGRGQAGIWAEGASTKATALFDDVRVRSARDVEDDFSRDVPGRWAAVSGTWNWNGAAQATSTSAAQALTGESGWSDYAISAPLALPGDASAGLIGHASEDGMYLLRVGGSKSRNGFAGKAQILKMSGGKAQVLATSTTGASLDGRASTLGFALDDGYLVGTVNGKRVVDAFDEALKSGRAGLWSWRAAGAPAFGGFGVRFSDLRPTWAKVPDLYEQEQQAETMGGWSTPQGFWLPAKPVGGKPGEAAVTITASAAKPSTLWHKGAFWGDGRLRFKVPELKDGQTFAVLLDGPSGAPKGETQVAFSVKNGELLATVSRDGSGKPLGAGKVKVEGKASDYTVDIRERGTFLVARAYKSEEERKTLFAARVR